MKKNLSIRHGRGRIPAVILVLGGFAVSGLTAHCGGGATCDAVCDNFMDKCYAGDSFLDGGDYYDLVRNDCLEQCGTRANAVPERCASERDNLLSCIASAPSVDCDDAQRSSACATENEHLDACMRNTATSTTSSTSSSATNATTAGGPTCLSDNECATGICNGKLQQCSTPGPEGFPCLSDSECTSDLCNGKLQQCSTPQALGGPCLSDSECQSDLCNGKTQQCATPGPAGGPCLSDSECQSNVCNNQSQTCA